MKVKKNRIIKIVLTSIIISLSFTKTIFTLDPQKQITQYGQSIWTNQNGLSANIVDAIIQTHDGYIWLGTTGGLLRFDGVQFVTVSTDTSDNNNNETITALCETHDGSLWIGTSTGLRRLKNGKLLHCDSQQGFPQKPITVLFESRDGHLWIGSMDGLFEYAEGRCYSIPITPLYITSIIEDKAGNIIIGTGKGIRFIKDGRWKQTNGIINQKGLPDVLFKSIYADQYIRTLYIDQSGNIWIGTINGLSCWRNRRIIEEKPSNNNSQVHINAICEDRDKNIWIGTTLGLYRFTEGNWTSFGVAQGIYVNKIIEDREGSIWICTSDGLIQFRDIKVTTYTTLEGLIDNFLSSILEAKDGSIYFLSAEHKGSIVKLKDGKLTQLPRVSNDGHSFVGPSFKSRDGSIWIAFSGSLTQLKNDHLIQYNKTSGLPDSWISAITEDSISLIIYIDRTGIRRFINGQLQPYLLSDGKEYLSTEFVQSLYYDPAGILWIGTTEGLVKIQEGKITKFGKAEGIEGIWINSFFKDRKSSIWMGSARNGLIHYRDGKFITYNAKSGLNSNAIYCVVVDDFEDVWITSSKGISRISHQDIENYETGRIKTTPLQTFTVADGLKTDECFNGWQPSAWKAHDGRLWFATVKGAVMINPKIFRRNNVPPPVYIEQFIGDMQPVQLNHFNSLKPGIGKLEFHYTALSYVFPNRVFFKYMLEGYDKEWIDAGTRRVAYYTNLPPGKYTFRVLACNNDAMWNKSDAKYSFEILPHFYETNWFKGLLALIIIGSTFGLYHIWIHRLLKRKNELEQKIKDRTAELLIAKEKAEYANKAKSDFLAKMSHELRTPFNAILGYSQILKNKNLPKKELEQINIIKQSGEHLLSIIDDILNIARMEVKKEELQINEFHLPSLIREVLSLTRVKAIENNLFLNYDEKTNFPHIVKGDAKKLRQILINIINNAIKYTIKGGIYFSVQSKIPDDGLKNKIKIIFIVQDTGVGISKENIDKIFEPFVHMDLDKKEVEGIGLGLAITKKLIEMMNGNISVISEIGVGSTFTFDILLEVTSSEMVKVETEEKVITGYLGEKMHILVTDDNPVNMDLLVSFLKPLGFNIGTASNGSETIEYAIKNKPDLILMDLLMPVMDGHTALKKIRNEYNLNTIKVIGVSAAVADKQRVTLFAADCDSFISKPIQIQELLDNIKRQLQLEWITFTANVDALKRPDDPGNKIPSQSILDEIITLAEMGDFSGVNKIISSLMNDNCYKAFCEMIIMYSNKYEDEAIINYIRKFK